MKRLAISIAVLSLISCTSAATPTATTAPRATTQPTNTVVATSTTAPASAPTQAPTNTPTVAPTATAQPTSTPVPPTATPLPATSTPVASGSVNPLAKIEIEAYIKKCIGAVNDGDLDTLMNCYTEAYWTEHGKELSSGAIFAKSFNIKGEILEISSISALDNGAYQLVYKVKSAIGVNQVTYRVVKERNLWRCAEEISKVPVQ